MQEKETTIVISPPPNQPFIHKLTRILEEESFKLTVSFLFPTGYSRILSTYLVPIHKWLDVRHSKCIDTMLSATIIRKSGENREAPSVTIQDIGRFGDPLSRLIKIQELDI